MLAGEEGSHLAGLFSAMIMPLSAVRTFVLALFVSLYPNLSRVYSLKDRKRIRRYIFKSVGIVGLFVSVSVLIYFFFGPQLIQLLYGKEYVVSRIDTTLVAICVGFFLFSLLLFRIHLSRGTPEYPSYSFLVSLLVLFLMIYGLNLEPLLLVEIALLACSFIFAVLQLFPLLLPRIFSKKG
jgi:O-antigen/teichoic acid export membrane protein